MEYGLEDREIEVRFRTGARDFSSQRPYRLWGSLSLLCRGSFPQGKAGGGGLEADH
jgi:hypothetical protein